MQSVFLEDFTFQTTFTHSKNNKSSNFQSRAVGSHAYGPIQSLFQSNLIEKQKFASNGSLNIANRTGQDPILVTTQHSGIQKLTMKGKSVKSWMAPLHFEFHSEAISHQSNEQQHFIYALIHSCSEFKEKDQWIFRWDEKQMEKVEKYKAPAPLLALFSISKDSSSACTELLAVSNDRVFILNDDCQVKVETEMKQERVLGYWHGVGEFFLLAESENVVVMRFIKIQENSLMVEAEWKTKKTVNSLFSLDLDQNHFYLFEKKELKQLDAKTGKFIKKVQFNFQPLSLTCISPNYLLITLKKQNQLEMQIWDTKYFLLHSQKLITTETESSPFVSVLKSNQETFLMLCLGYQLFLFPFYTLPPTVLNCLLLSQQSEKYLVPKIEKPKSIQEWKQVLNNSENEMNFKQSFSVAEYIQDVIENPKEFYNEKFMKKLLKGRSLTNQMFSQAGGALKFFTGHPHLLQLAIKNISDLNEQDLLWFFDWILINKELFKKEKGTEAEQFNYDQLEYSLLKKIFEIDWDQKQLMKTICQFTPQQLETLLNFLHVSIEQFHQTPAPPEQKWHMEKCLTLFQCLLDAQSVFLILSENFHEKMKQISLLIRREVGICLQLETLKDMVKNMVNQQSPVPVVKNDLASVGLYVFMSVAATRTGGIYIPPHRLKQLQPDNESDKQRLYWDALKKSINGLINKVNAGNIKEIVIELFQENLIRGRGLFCRSLMKSQQASPVYSNVYACLVGILNTKLPQLAQLLLHRLLLQIQKAFRRNDKQLLLTSSQFLCQLVNFRVTHEIVLLQLLALLLERPTEDSVEVSCLLLKNCGKFLMENSGKALNATFERLRQILHQHTQLEKRVQYMIEVLFQIRKTGFKDFPIINEDLDLVEEEEVMTHYLSLDDVLNPEEQLDVFQFDPEFEQNEEKYKQIKQEIIGDSSDEEEEDDDDEESEEETKPELEMTEEEKMKNLQKQFRIQDKTGTNLVHFRRTIYLTLMSSLDFEEACHKLLGMKLKPGEEKEMVVMIVECCSQERSYEKYYGLIGERLSKLNRMWQQLFGEHFHEIYSSIHRFETNRIRNMAKFFAHLFSTEALPWQLFQPIVISESATSSSSRIFIKILFLELVTLLGLPKLMQILHLKKMEDTKEWTDEELEERQTCFGGMFPMHSGVDVKDVRFSINYWTSVGLGILTEEMRFYLKNLQQLLEMKSDSDSDSDSDSESESEYSSSTSQSSRRSRSRTPPQREISRTPPKRKRSFSPARRDERSRTPPRREKSRTPPRRKRSFSPVRRDERSRTPPRRRDERSITPPRKRYERSRSPPRRRSRSPRGRSPYY